MITKKKKKTKIWVRGKRPTLSGWGLDTVEAALDKVLKPLADAVDAVQESMENAVFDVVREAAAEAIYCTAKDDLQVWFPVARCPFYEWKPEKDQSALYVGFPLGGDDEDVTIVSVSLLSVVADALAGLDYIDDVEGKYEGVLALQKMLASLVAKLDAGIALAKKNK